MLNPFVGCRRKIARATYSLLAVASLLSPAVWPGAAMAGGEIIRLDEGQSSSIVITKGKTRSIQAGQRFDEIVIGDPEVASVTPLSDNSFYVLGNSIGTTAIAMFDENKVMIGSIDVEVTLDADQIAGTIRSAVPGSRIKVRAANGGIILSGKAEDAVEAEKARRIAARFAPEGEIVNTVDVISSQQVQLNVRFVEINRDVGKELGTRISTVYANAGGGIGFNSAPQTSGNTPAGSLIGSLVDGGFSIDVAIDALEDRGVARRLAEPNLIARSGQSASFLAGGEFPIPVSEEDGVVTITYKQFGVGLDFTPTVLSGGLISLDIKPEVSAIDQTASYRVGEIVVPGFSVRRARTSVDLKSGQSFMIAGLLQSDNNLITQRVPGLGKLPVLGALFSSKAYQRRETDLVIIVTPHLVKPMDPTKKPATPTDNTVVANDKEFFLGNMEEVATTGSVKQGTARLSKTGTVPIPASGHYLEVY